MLILCWICVYKNAGLVFPYLNYDERYPCTFWLLRFKISLSLNNIIMHTFDNFEAVSQYYIEHMRNHTPSPTSSQHYLVIV